MKSTKISCRIISLHLQNIIAKQLATVAQRQRLKDFCNPSVTQRVSFINTQLHLPYFLITHLTASPIPPPTLFPSAEFSYPRRGYKVSSQSSSILVNKFKPVCSCNKRSNNWQHTHKHTQSTRVPHPLPPLSCSKWQQLPCLVPGPSDAKVSARCGLRKYLHKSGAFVFVSLYLYLSLCLLTTSLCVPVCVRVYVCG